MCGVDAQNHRGLDAFVHIFLKSLNNMVEVSQLVFLPFPIHFSVCLDFSRRKLRFSFFAFRLSFFVLYEARRGEYLYLYLSGVA